ncbi:MAG: SIMPL domain-containing protein [Gammaproteobacteria bacterium]|nr:SIMPL domain-containing protein [Gammaproteobacteria bacterium]
MISLPIRYASVLLIALILCSPLLRAGDKPVIYDQVQLSANASMQVENDTLTAQLYAQQEGSDLSRLADEVNQKISEVVALVKQVEDIELQTLGYQTYPTYHQQRVTGWRVRQTIRIESQDSPKLSQLLSQLQSTLALESLNYSISPAQREAAEEKLIGQAISSFQKRAAQVTQHLGRQEYRLVQMNINTSGQPIQPVRMRASMMAMEAAVAPPSLEAGSQSIRVDVSGTIELQVQQ